MKQIEVELPAWWASALVNNDWTGLNDAEANECKAWVRANHLISIHSCSEESSISRYNGLQCDMLVYYGATDVWRARVHSVRYAWLYAPRHSQR